MKTLFDTWGVSSDNFILAGFETPIDQNSTGDVRKGALLHVHGNGDDTLTIKHAVPEIDQQLNGIFGISETDVYAVGNYGTILHYGDLPESPRLSSPADNSADGGTAIDFSWYKAENATAYWIQFATDPGFNALYGGAGLEYALSDSAELDYAILLAQQIHPFPADGIRIYWRVKAMNSAGESAFSEPYSFINYTVHADLDGDGDVDGTDLASLMAQIGSNACPCPADLDNDGDVDQRDMEFFTTQFGGI